jgi:transcriptional regulator with XRE-family HTH domain
MEKHENNQLRETTTTDIIAHELDNETNDPAFVEEYLKEGFLASAIDALFYARRQAALTQAQVAERLHTKQASIARLEADTSGSLTLRRYVEVALACGMVPLDITLAPIDSVRDFVRSHPDSPLTQELFQAWMKANIEAQQV